MSFAAGILALLVLADPTPAAVTPVDPTAIARLTLEDLGAGRFDRAFARFDPTLQAGLPLAKLPVVWRHIEAQLGTFVGTGKVEAQPGDPVQVRVLGRFSKSDGNFLVVVDGQGRVAGFWFRGPVSHDEWTPPSYSHQANFVEWRVEVGEKKLPGTLSLPEGVGPFPAVVLIGGSGSPDGDETYGPNRIFKDLAFGLASRDVAVLRFPRRALVDPGSKVPTVREEVMDDVDAAVEALTRWHQVDRRRIYLVGHSLGGTLAPRIAAGDSKVAGIVLLAGANEPFGAMLIRQTRYLATVNGQPAPTAEQEAVFHGLDEGPLDPNARVMGAPGSYFLDLRTYDPLKTAQKLTIPIFILQGERDYQVDLANYDRWKKGLMGHLNARFKLYPSLNHFFIKGEGTPSPAEYDRPGHLAVAVVNDIASFVTAKR